MEKTIAEKIFVFKESLNFYNRLQFIDLLEKDYKNEIAFAEFFVAISNILIESVDGVTDEIQKLDIIKHIEGKEEADEIMKTVKELMREHINQASKKKKK